MKIKLITVITIFSLCFILGYEKISYSLDQIPKDNISELKILNYLQKDNKTFFISNSKSSKIIDVIRKNYMEKEKNNLVIIKHSILAYLGIDLGANNIEDIYNNELMITSHDNKEKDIDDILIIFKINEKKNIDDILNLTNKIDEPEKIIKIFRENKLNYLNYIYRTNDNYIITSSSKFLILDALKQRNDNAESGLSYIYFKNLLNNFANENNILFTKNFNVNKSLTNEQYVQSKEDYIATLFNFDNKKIILKSYLINNKKNLNMISYKKVTKENILDKTNYQILIYNDFLNYVTYIKLSSFEKDILKELNKKLKQNILLLVSEDNWIAVFDKNKEFKVSLENLNILKDFNNYSLEKNNTTYKIYSKNILQEEDNIINQLNYKNIFSAESDKLTFLSNNLINSLDIDFISKEFLNLEDKSYPKYFLDKQIIFKNPNSLKYHNVYKLKKINYFLSNLINLSVIEFREMIKQSIPETSPIYYTEIDLKIF